MESTVVLTVISAVLGILLSLIKLATQISKLGGSLQKLTDEIYSFNAVKDDVQDLKKDAVAIKVALAKVTTTVDVIQK